MAGRGRRTRVEPVIVAERTAGSSRVVTLEVWGRTWVVVVMDYTETEVEELDEFDDSREALKAFKGVA